MRGVWRQGMGTILQNYIAEEMPWYEDDYLEDLRFYRMNTSIVEVGRNFR